MEITNKQRSRLLELIRGQMSEMYHYSVPKKTDIYKELRDLVYRDQKITQTMRLQLIDLVSKGIKSLAERNDEIAGQYIERFAQNTINNIEGQVFAKKIKIPFYDEDGKMVKDDIVDDDGNIIGKRVLYDSTKESKVILYPFIPDSQGDMSTMLGMINKMKKKRKKDRRETIDPYLEALQDVRAMARKIYRGDSSVTFDYQDKVCIKCYKPFTIDSSVNFADKRGFIHTQVIIKDEKGEIFDKHCEVDDET